MNSESQRKPASAHTRELNRAAADVLGIDPEHAINSEYELARAHCLREADGLEINDAAGQIVWSTAAFDFLKADAAPDSVNPSLWAHSKADHRAGLFSVLDNRILQLRGFDLANLTLVRSHTGWIVLDTLTTIETAAAALDFAEEALGEPIRDRIRAIIISHSHADHFGGVRGVIDQQQVGFAQQGKVPIYAPAGFEEAVVKESVYAGAAMRRRGDYQFGTWRDCGERATVDSGIGLATPTGTMSFLRPTDSIKRDQTLVIDGLTIDFQLTPGTEAPAEMNNYFHDYRALWVAENCTGTLHNLYPIRGARIRDAQGWASYLLAAIRRYADRSDVVFQAHQWPHFNTPEHPDAVTDYLTNTAAAYKYVHDQTLLYANQGMSPKEIARTILVPDAIQRNWYVRPYYGSVEINARAVFNRYLGYYNGNPVTLHPLSERDAGRKFVEYVGSEDRVLERARADLKRGEYQSAAYASNQVVFANPDNQTARLICADALEQLGYQAESSIWRNAYLQGAKELRSDPTTGAGAPPRSNPELLEQMTPPMLLDYLGIVIDGERAQAEDFRFLLTVSGADHAADAFDVHLYHGVLLTAPAEPDPAGLPYARFTVAQLGALTAGGPLPDGLDTNCRELLEKLCGYVVPLGELPGFDLVKPATRRQLDPSRRSAVDGSGSGSGSGRSQPD